MLFSVFSLVKFPLITKQVVAMQDICILAFYYSTDTNSRISLLTESWSSSFLCLSGNFVIILGRPWAKKRQSYPKGRLLVR